MAKQGKRHTSGAAGAGRDAGAAAAAYAAPYEHSDDSGPADPVGAQDPGTESMVGPTAEPSELVSWRHTPGAGIASQWMETGIGSVYPADAPGDCGYEDMRGGYAQRTGGFDVDGAVQQ
jgi:hypothetical protein